MTNRLLPQSDEHSRTYWEAAADGRLLIQQCTACARYQFYPRQHCVHCLAPDPGWVESAGLGTIYSYTVVHWSPLTAFADQVPYVLALVDLDEGVRLTTNIVTENPEELHCGAPVQVEFHEVEHMVLPMFTLLRS